MTAALTLFEDRADAEALRHRIYNVVPVQQYCFDTLLSLLDIVVTESIPTAAVRCGAAPVMLVNPKFVAEQCAGDEELFTLIAHELHHVLLGHTRLCSSMNAAQNIAFDAVINAYISRLFGPLYTGLFTRYYDNSTFPYFLLRPPVGWPDRPNWKAPILTGVPLRLCDLHQNLYSPTGVTYDEVLSAITTYAAEASLEGVSLLGNHEGDGYSSGDISLLRSVFQENIKSCGISTAFRQVTVDTKRRPSNRSIIRSAFRHAAFGQRRCSNRVSDVDFRTQIGPIPSMTDRKANVASALGRSPLLYARHTASRYKNDSEKVHLYLDVSGSVYSLLPTIFSSLKPFASQLHNKVHQFSCSITDVSVRDLAKGVCCTDGGTKIGPVVSHIISSKVKKALILTDGHVGEVDAADAAVLRRLGTKVTVLLTHDGLEDEIAPITSRFFKLNLLEKN